MKQQELAESLKVESDERSTLRSELLKKEKLNEELRKENEVTMYLYMYLHVRIAIVHSYVRMCSLVYCENKTVKNNLKISEFIYNS